MFSYFPLWFGEPCHTCCIYVVSSFSDITSIVRFRAGALLVVFSISTFGQIWSSNVRCDRRNHGSSRHAEYVQLSRHYTPCVAWPSNQLHVTTDQHFGRQPTSGKSAVLLYQLDWTSACRDLTTASSWPLPCAGVKRNFWLPAMCAWKEWSSTNQIRSEKWLLGPVAYAENFHGGVPKCQIFTWHPNRKYDKKNMKQAAIQDVNVVKQL